MTKYTHVSTDDICIMTLHGKQGVFLLNHHCYISQGNHGVFCRFSFSFYHPKHTIYSWWYELIFLVVKVQNKRSSFCTLYAYNIFVNVFCVFHLEFISMRNCMVGPKRVRNVSSIIYFKICLLYHIL